MNPVQTVNSNHTFGPPPGREGLVGDLPCEIVESDGEGVIFSVWEPTEGERTAIADGQNVRLGVGWIGGFPPVSLGITPEGPVAASA